jgi:hypothetical protein
VGDLNQRIIHSTNQQSHLPKQPLPSGVSSASGKQGAELRRSDTIHAILQDLIGPFDLAYDYDYQGGLWCHIGTVLLGSVSACHHRSYGFAQYTAYAAFSIPTNNKPLPHRWLTTSSAVMLIRKCILALSPLLCAALSRSRSLVFGQDTVRVMRPDAVLR